MANVELKYSHVVSQSDPNDKTVVIIGQLHALTSLPFELVKPKLEPRVDAEGFKAAVRCLHPSPTDACSLWFNNATVAVLPLKSSRHNCPARSHSITKLVKTCLTGVGDENVVLVCQRSNVYASGCAVARAFPLFTRKSGSAKLSPRTVTVEFILVGDDKDKPLTESEMSTLESSAASIRLAQRIVDTPCNEMNTDDFITEIHQVQEKLKSIGKNVKTTIIRGEELNKKGFGGIYGVGKAAINPPALAVLSYTPDNATQTISWVGKGIVYDTGGLSIKGKTTMPGMKRDCGGAAAILGAFQAAVQQGFQENLHAVLCLAENSVGPIATRPDDIHVMYSGRSVEINNTDAEGRLVLADGVSYASKDLKSDIIVDMATLTGAQGISTGKIHGAILTNREEWELACVKAGKNSGDLVFPLVYCPEIHFNEFASAVADMKNSVSDRGNAQSSCAGLFIGAHIGFDFPGVWLHIDMASPVHSGERATGYGVALLLSLFGRAFDTPLLQSVSPLGNTDDEEIMENASKKMKLV
ncbi:putative aminopeptidase NPEPL1 [Saccoglossus kowalevskii]|uniref:Probable aminopeptidase NPEPL1-like n=1 Tax=Saccoglossus kowalevskii TaxID=10224 RepID=A0ABM0GSC6_SACKO|nr:PREDICTED: probable aminopeptidase NPEPL1-like [Saccoglossus kowalevskii]